MTEKSTPKWKEQDALRRGQEAHHLATTYQTFLEARLQPGFIDSLAADLALLSESRADRLATKTEQKGQTGTERAVALDGKDWVMMIRHMAKRTDGIGAGVLKSLGVGERLHQSSTDRVVGAIDACLRTFAENPDLAGQIGLVEADIAEGQTIIDTLRTADQGQTEVMTERKDKTFDRNEVQMRVEAAVDIISTRGAMAFRKDIDIRARFEALISTAGPASEPASKSQVDAVAS